MHTILIILFSCAAWLAIGAFFGALGVLQNRSWDIHRVRWCDLVGLIAISLAGPITAIVFLLEFITAMESEDFWNSPIWKKKKENNRK